jgi:myo-inositol-1(or 4)-monophosphatase
VTTYSAPLARAEESEFVPFMHELIGIAFATIRGHFMTGTAVVTKGDASPVTMADRNAEAAMRHLIERRYPRHAIVGEEHGNKPGERYRWVLDPIDGTRAFITNCFLFGTLIGHTGESTLYASDGSSRAARVRPCTLLADATVLATTHWSTGEQRGGAAVERIIRAAKLYRTWGDCFGYFALATGGADLMLDPTLAYWDVAAIVPVVEGAGGAVTAWQGGNPLADLSLIASAGPLNEAALELLRQG